MTLISALNFPFYDFRHIIFKKKNTEVLLAPEKNHSKTLHVDVRSSPFTHLE